MDVPLSDNDILEIQEKFLSNGFHYLKWQNAKQGRTMMYCFLDSLSRYHDVACLTIDPFPMRETITDMYTELYDGGYLRPGESYYLEEYFIERFYFDFIWIEATPKLLASNWFQDVKHKIIDLGIDQQIPIVVTIYEQ
jgi:hypothetical protein